MLRTIAILVVLIIAVLYVPLWVQIVAFVVAVIVTPYRLVLLIPAVLSDVLYGYSGHLSFMTVLMTLLVSGLLLVHWFLFTKTRLKTMFYDVET